MKMNLIAAAALTAATLSTGYAADFKAGDWTLSLGGNINAFYTYSDCRQPAGTVSGLALGDAVLACGGSSNSTVIGNGLLPSQLSGGAKSTQSGFDIAAVFTLSAATSTNSSLAANNGVDVRNAYMTIGTKDMGTFKLGRDYGTFGANATLGDMTLLGIGAATRATQRGRVSLGHIGAGYAYLGTYGQMVYTTPSISGFNADVGVYSPVDVTLGGSQTADDTPQFQGRVSFASGAFKGWAGYKYQSFQQGVGLPRDFNMSAGEIGGSVNLGAFDLIANYQDGKGLGILSDGDQGDVKTRHTLVQGTYKVTPNIKLGLGWGKSENHKNITAAANNLESNQNVTGGVYYNLTPQITVTGELGQTKSEAFNGVDAKQNSLAFGAIFFF